VIAVLAALATVAFALPAAIVTHFLPGNVAMTDLSGSLWHGSAGRLTVNNLDAGAIEWRLAPLALLGLTVAADVHWVKAAFVLDAAVRIRGGVVAAHDIRGGGPLQDLADLGVPAAVRGMATITMTRFEADSTRVRAIAGDLGIAALSLQSVADGADLGGYALKFGADAVSADGTVTGRLADTGGPLQLGGTVIFTPATHTGMISGTLQERGAMPTVLARELNGIAQLRGRDRDGRIPVDLEFSF
jgi:hypothetical protein